MHVARWYQESLRALWATTVVICMLAVGARPAARDDIREQRSSYLDSAHGAVASPLIRRIGLPDAHQRTLYVVPTAVVDGTAPRTAVVVEPVQPLARSFVRFIGTGSSRGPPRG